MGPPLLPRIRRLCSMVRALEGAPHRELGALPDLGDHVDLASMRGDDLVRDMETQARSGADLLGGEEGLEDLPHVLRRDAPARISDPDAGLLVLDPGAEMDVALLRNGLAGIDQQIDEDLLEALPVARHRRQLPVVLVNRRLVLDLIPADAERVLEALVEVGRMQLRRIDVREFAEAADDVTDLLAAELAVGDDVRAVGDQVFRADLLP